MVRTIVVLPAVSRCIDGDGVDRDFFSDAGESLSRLAADRLDHAAGNACLTGTGQRLSRSREDARIFGSCARWHPLGTDAIGLSWHAMGASRRKTPA